LTITTFRDLLSRLAESAFAPSGAFCSQQADNGHPGRVFGAKERHGFRKLPVTGHVIPANSSVHLGISILLTPLPSYATVIL
jgi:hypothetical protein